MISVVITRLRDEPTLEMQHRRIPEPGSGELLIRVVAAGINRPDVAQRKGHYPAPAWAPQDIPGLEVSGVVSAVGPGCRRFRQGDRVCALLSGGGYAEYALALEGHTLPIPPGWSMEEAAGFPETTFTVWQNVFEIARLGQGENLLVHGGTSGIGVTAIQLAKAHGARVLVTCGRRAKCEKALRIGADHAILHTDEDFSNVVRRSTDEVGAHVILDMVGGPYLSGNLNCLAMDGRLAMINFIGGAEASIPLPVLLKKRLTISGSTLRNRSDDYKSRLAMAIETHVFPWTQSGQYKPVVDRYFELKDAMAAHRLMESGAHVGKIILLTGYSG